MINKLIIYQEESNGSNAESIKSFAITTRSH